MQTDWSELPYGGIPPELREAVAAVQSEWSEEDRLRHGRLFEATPRSKARMERKRKQQRENRK